MIVAEGRVVERGLRVEIRSVCNQGCMAVNRHEGRKVSVTVPNGDVEELGFALAVVLGIQRALEEFPELVELIDH